MGRIVFVENGDGHTSRMWYRWGWELTSEPALADVIQFTGGADVDPALYGEVAHPTVHPNLERDAHCIALYNMAIETGIKMVGICRGGQFLNVMNGGKMFQHCDGHGLNDTHKATILATGLEVDVTSTHHQIMRPNREDGIVLMEANPKLGTFKEHMMFHGGRTGWAMADRPYEDDVEAVFYPETQSLCYQPHPEWRDDGHGCVEAFKYFLRNHLDLTV